MTNTHAQTEAEQRFQLMLDLNSIWYWEQNEKFQFTKIVAGAAQPPSRLIGLCRWELTACVPVSATWEAHTATLQAHQSFRDFQYVWGADGQRHYIAASGEPVFLAGRFVGYRGTARDITEEMGSIESMRKTKSLLRMAMRVSRIGAWAVDLPDQAITWSAEVATLHEVGPDFRPTRQSATDFFTARSRAGVDAAVQACIDRSQPFDLEAELRTARGSRRWVRLIGEAQHDALGRPSRIQGAVQDITALHDQAEETRLLAQRLENTLESLTDAFFTIDRRWRFTYVNPEAERLLRRPRRELVGQLLWEEFPEALESRFHHEYERALAQFDAVEFEEFYPPLQRWFMVKAFPSHQGLAVCFRDTTEQRRNVEALKSSEEHYRMLFQNSMDAIMNTTPDGAIHSANAAACELFGMSEERLRAAGRQGLVCGDDRLALLIERRRRTGRARGELTMIHATGAPIHVDVQSAQYMGRDGQLHANVVMRDIGPRLRAQQAIVELNAQLEQRVTQRTEELQEANAELQAFSYSLAHDLRTPLAAINMFCDVLSRTLRGEDRDRCLNFVDRVQASAKQIDEFTQGLLSMAQIAQSTLEMGFVDLSVIAARLLAEMREREPNRAVRVVIEPDLLVRGDRRLLEIALLNLLANAWKFTANEPLATICFSARDEGDDLVYFVRDNGAGFDMEGAGKLFQSFSRMHSQDEFPGTGVGLSTVRRIVSRHGGRIWAEAKKGQGAAFYFTLPGRPVSPLG